jgi:hypothetical protein
MNFKEFYIPTSLHYSLDPLVHPFVIVVLSMFYYILCPICTSVSCAYDCLLSLVYDVCVFSFD